MNCNPQALLQAAACYRCIPNPVMRASMISLLCEWASASESTCNHPIVLDWLSRIAADSQPIPSNETIAAVCDFCDGLDNSGLMDKMLVVNPVIPDSLSSMRYPLIYQAVNGLSPWTNINFVAADLGPNGLSADGSKSFDIGFNPFAHWGVATTSGGLSIYESEPVSVFGNDEVEIGNSDIVQDEYLYLASWDDSSSLSIALCWAASSTINVGGIDTPAFYSCSRVSNTSFNLYRASNTIPLVSIGNNPASQAGETIPDGTTYAFAAYSIPGGGGVSNSSKTLSFIAIHEGLTLDETKDFYNLVQTLRMQLGGGWV